MNLHRYTTRFKPPESVTYGLTSQNSDARMRVNPNYFDKITLPLVHSSKVF